MAQESTTRKNSVNDVDVPQIQIPLFKAITFLAILYLLFFFDFAVRVGIGPLLPLIQKDLQLTDAQLGLINTVVLVGMAVFVLPLSYLSDRWSRKKSVFMMATIWSACTIISSFATRFSVFIAARFGLGVGESSYNPTSTSLISTWFKKSAWGKVLGIYGTSMPMGIIGGSLFCGYMGGVAGWRNTILMLGIPSLIIGFFALLLPDYKAKTKSEDGSVTTAQVSLKNAASTIFKNKTLLKVYLAFGFSTIGSSTIMAWFSVYCVRVLGTDIPKAGMLFAILALVAAISFPISGLFIDRFSKLSRGVQMYIGAGETFLTACFYGAGFYFQSLPLIYIGVFFDMSYVVINYMSTQELVPVWFKAVAFGGMVFFQQLLGSLGPWLTGVISDKSNLIYGLAFIQIAYLICTVIYIWAAMTYKRDYQIARDEEEASGLQMSQV